MHVPFTELSCCTHFPTSQVAVAGVLGPCMSQGGQEGLPEK